MKTIHTSVAVVESESEDLPVSPKYEIGDYMEIYCGHREGHNFTIRDVRFNYDWFGFEYLNFGFVSEWYREESIVLVHKKRAA